MIPWLFFTRPHPTAEADPRSATLSPAQIAEINARVLRAWGGYSHGGSGPDEE